MFGKIKDTRGYTHKGLLWGTSWLNLLMEAADAPRYVKGKKAAPVIETKEQLYAALGKKAPPDLPRGEEKEKKSE